MPGAFPTQRFQVTAPGMKHGYSMIQHAKIWDQSILTYYSKYCSSCNFVSTVSPPFHSCGLPCCAETAAVKCWTLFAKLAPNGRMRFRPCKSTTPRMACRLCRMGWSTSICPALSRHGSVRSCWIGRSMAVVVRPSTSTCFLTCGSYSIFGLLYHHESF